MLDYKNPRLIIETGKVKPGSITWQSPSNIALVKYWGKHGQQLPRNPSVSFTLSAAHTRTTLDYRPKQGVDRGIALDFYFNDKLNPSFENKVLRYLEGLNEVFPFLRQLELSIRSYNSFPHSAGIASSASSMSALALCLCSLEQALFKSLVEKAAFRQKASFIARLGSGSASRSIFAKASIWGKTSELDHSSDLYAIPYGEALHPSFRNFHDDILIVHAGEKSVSSRAGHQLMEGNVYAETRYRQARQRLLRLLAALQSGDLEVFGGIVEEEALTLHALMMSSTPPYLLIQPNTIHLINKIWAFRRETNTPLYFTLDAGPNLHLLYPDNVRSTVQNFIQSELVEYCQNGKVIQDQVGDGPTQL